MKLLAVSEYNVRVGSGYTTIAHGLLSELERRGHEVLFIAFDYDGAEHPLKATVVPTDQKVFPGQVVRIRAGFRPDALVVMHDLSIHYGLRFLQGGETPYIGIFPIEADPLVHPSEWTNAVDTMHAALCESRFGTKLLNDVGIEARYFPVGVDEFWRPPSRKEREEARRQRNLEDAFVVLTVCDNHERKNLPAHYAAIALLAGKQVQWPPELGHFLKLDRFRGLIPPIRSMNVPNVYYIVNTKRRPQKVGYDNYALTERFGISDRCMVLEHSPSEGLGREELRALYWCADAYLQLSKAEGLGLPVMEAQACGVPVVGTDCTGIKENLEDGRGFLVPPEWVHIGPYQNQHRRWADPMKAAEHLSLIARNTPGKTIFRASKYAREMTWARSADVFEEALHDVTSGAKAQGQNAPEGTEQPAAAVR